MTEISFTDRLHWLWWAGMPLEDFTDVTLVIEETDDYDDRGDHNDLDDHKSGRWKLINDCGWKWVKVNEMGENGWRWMKIEISGWLWWVTIPYKWRQNSDMTLAIENTDDYHAHNDHGDHNDRDDHEKGNSGSKLGNTSWKDECFLSGIARITPPPPPFFRATCTSFSAVKDKYIYCIF